MKLYMDNSYGTTLVT